MVAPDSSPKVSQHTFEGDAMFSVLSRSLKIATSSIKFRQLIPAISTIAGLGARCISTSVLPHVQGYHCDSCGIEVVHDRLPDSMQCPEHGENLDVVYNYDVINEHLHNQGFLPRQDMWRYRALLPLSHSAKVPKLLVGGTPLYRALRLEPILGVDRLFVKDDSRNPTGSLKDRASALIVAKVQHEHPQVITTASTGNAGAALAGMCAAAGCPCVIFVPASAPVAKLTQLAVYGAHVVLVDGNYDAAFDTATMAAAKFGWYNRSTGINPFTVEGKKSVAFEICEQLARFDRRSPMFQVPDWIVVPMGDGNIISAVRKGICDLVHLGFLDHTPRLLGVQAEGSAAITNAWKVGGREIVPVNATTVADSIAADLPRDGHHALRAVRATNGACVTVSDEAILSAIPLLAKHTGVFPEPAAAAGLAGLQLAREQSIVSAGDQVALLVTGSGLKDIPAAQSSVPSLPTVEPYDMERLARTMRAEYGIEC